jgi:hypothetical protein
VPDDSVSSVVEQLRATLEAAGVTYAFGGAIALAAWSEPRATADVDVILWLDPERELDRAIELIRRAGVTLDEESARANAVQRGMFVGQVGLTRVDVFVPSIPFYEVAQERRVRTLIGGQPTWVHSAEVLAVFKMLFFRPKDLLDVERMLVVLGKDFDRAFVRGSLVEMLGDDDRIVKWDALCERADRAT